VALPGKQNGIIQAEFSTMRPEYLFVRFKDRVALSATALTYAVATDYPVDFVYYTLPSVFLYVFFRDAMRPPAEF